MNLLYDRIFRIVNSDGKQFELTLPGLLSALGKDEVYSMPGLQRHQEDAFYIFLCYLAGMILARSGIDNPVQDEAFWEKGLIKLAGNSEEQAWKVVETDFSKTAFMQPPLPKEDHKKLKPKANTPDELDLLQTAKDHDVKISRAKHYSLDEWIFALISLQTMSGYLGKGNQGICRMNSGFGNRPVVEVIHSKRLGLRFVQALPRLLACRPELLKGPWNYKENGLGLIWLREWDGKKSLNLSEMDPFFIEICRRIRLTKEPKTNRIKALAVPSDKPRIAAKELCGNVGDPWLPIDQSRHEGKEKCDEPALTVGPSGLTPELVRRLVFHDGFKMTKLQEPLNRLKGSVWLYVSVLIRGQGTTDGFHERMIQIPSNARKRLFAKNKEDKDEIAFLSKTGIEYAGRMENNVLKPAIFSFLESSPEKIDFQNETITAWWAAMRKTFTRRWEDNFFPWLWQSLEIGQQSALKEWASRLRDNAIDVLEQAMDTLPCKHGKKYKARSGALRTFWGALFNDKNFPFLKEKRNEPDVEKA